MASELKFASTRAARREFAVRTGLVVLILCGGLVVYLLTELLLLIFAAFLVVVMLHAMADPVARRTRLPRGVALAVTSMLLFVSLLALMVGFGREIASQLELAAEQLPQAVEQVLAWLDRIGLDREIVVASLNESTMIGSGASIAADYLADLVGLLVAFILAIVAGGYIAAQPQVYVGGFLALFPPSKSEEIDRVGRLVVAELKRWLVGQLAIMAFVGALTGLGAWFLGLPAPLALALIATVLEFIPYLGPILITVPAVLLALTVSLETALLMLGWVILVQQIEGYVLTPVIQRQAISLPPAVTLFSLVTAGLLFGLPGVVLALPLAVVGHVLYGEWVEHQARAHEGMVFDQKAET